ncbi:MAG: hypothetical protein V2A34_02935 [Lentisphaerota bacterium]
MKLGAIICSVLVALANGWNAGAANYYVSSIRAGRSDSNAGTSSNAPWATFDKVKSMWGGLNDGDTVHLERGSAWNLTFSDDYWYVSSGGSAAGGTIMIRGDDYGTGAKPILRRTDGSGSSAFFVIQTSYVTFRDFVLDGGSTDYGKATLGIAIGDDNANISNVTIKNMTIRNLGGSSSDYICGIWVVSPGYTVSDCLIEGNEVSYYSAHGLNHYSPGPMVNIVWRNNVVKNSFGGGRYPSANSALQITSGSRGCLFENNYLEDATTTEGCILGFGKYANDTGTNTIRFNVIVNSDEFGVLFTIDHTAKRLMYDFYGNIVYNNDKSGFALHPYNSYTSGTVFNVYNNTFYKNYTDGGADSSKGEIELASQCNNTLINLFNNLVYHPNYGSTVGLGVASGFSGTLTHGNNLFYHEGGSNKTVVSHGTTYTMATIRNYEPTAQRGDPLFLEIARLPVSINSTNGAQPDGLDLTAPSVASTNGLNLGSRYALDITRKARTAPWSIGAYQYSIPSHRPKPPKNMHVVE